MNNTIESDIQGASASAKSTITAAGDIMLTAGENATINSEIVTAAVAVGVQGGSVGISLADNTVSSGITAYADNATITSTGGQISIGASSQDSVNTLSVATSIAAALGGAAAGGSASADVSPIVSAYVGSGATLNAAGAISLNATTTNGASASTYGIAIGFLAVGTSTATASADGSTMAYIDGGVTGCGSLTVQATANDSSDAQATAFAGGIIAGGGAAAAATTAPAVTADVDGNGAISSTGTVEVNAQDTPDAQADTLGLDVGAVSIGVNDSTSTSAGTTSAYLGNGVTIVAPSLEVEADRSQDASGDPTASSSAIAGSGGVLFGANATVSSASSGGSVRATTGQINPTVTFTGTLTSGSKSVTGITSTAGLVVGQIVTGAGIPLGTTIASIVPSTSSTPPGSITLSTAATAGGSQKLTTTSPIGTLTITATNTSDQSAMATGVSIGGILALGASVATASSNVKTLAQLGPDTIVAGTINVTATGTDINNVTSIAGSGGLFAGDAAVGNTNDTSTVQAEVGGDLSAGTINVSAKDNSVYVPDVSSWNSAAAGASGASAQNNDTINATAMVDNGTTINAASAVNITAQNTYTENNAPSEETVLAGAGGVFNGTAAISTSNLGGTALVKIGNSVTILVLAAAAGTDGISMSASSNLNTTDLVALITGGGIEVGGSNSTLNAKPVNTVSTGTGDGFMTNQSIAIGTYTNANDTNTAYLDTWGVLARGVIRTETPW